MERGKNTEVHTEPRDAYKIAYVIHFLLGAGNLIPWNALITAIDYFGSIYSTRHVEKVFSVAYMTSSVLVLVVMISWGSNLSKKLTFRLRMNIGFSMFILSIMASPIIDWAWFSKQSRVRSATDFNLVVAAVIFCGLADGLIGGSLIGSSGNLPKQYMQAVFAGTASSGVLVSILRIITKAAVPHSPQGLRTSAHFYFIFSTVILLTCLVCCNLLHKLPIMQEHYKFQQYNLPSTSPKFWDVVRIIRWPAFGIFMIYTVTLSIFPGFLAENVQSNILGDWYPLLLITAYNVSDLAGKSFTAIYVLKGIRKATWGSISRLLFYPLFTVCLHGSKWMKTEVPVIFLTFMLGLTNGYLTSVIMIQAPKSVSPSEAEVAAVVMALFLGLGLVAGSVVGWLWII
ncbi:hypothetical protein DCAR_0520412 [Daucus carota subsp. sativus]|uniref:Equilibrative nucleoside transporter n=1 Tax=Daucus carota subsp. sativus TaxID=79200 RepID=A0A164YIL5_DAUCS|nr:PREDICTED: equilibrative nucleotide transporter 8 [Daucus carota subsp. sativus]WOH01034.1 hypothetical protein DCAR_0520412 [Daucus carota subsp. sativus]